MKRQGDGFAERSVALRRRRETGADRVDADAGRRSVPGSASRLPSPAQPVSRRSNGIELRRTRSSTFSLAADTEPASVTLDQILHGY